MQKQQPERLDGGLTPSVAINVVYFFANCLACITLPFVRFGFGGEGIAFFGLGAIVIVFFWGGATGSYLTIQFIGLWLLAVLVQRLRTGFGWIRGEVVHSRYQGDSVIAGLITRNHKLVRLIIEPAMIVGGGYLVWGFFSMQLGFLLMVSGGASLLVNVFDFWATHVRVRALHDARIEQQYLAALYRGRQ